ncbi:peptidase [Streptacidiphilus pinicola]|uniref:Peptidase n=2 Tax=Streptacidiphilus pinicola TaxID=2219663 RepID=A0A2X0KKQ2_9ACTN|nr:LPXTG cell wall anchor domain-containing protein [Streptacidiphilus pinicola]RAG87529.1 peptidase [Streptacidiphilus pinicola]
MATAAAVVPAQATTVPVNYNCQTPIGAKSAVSQVEITASPSGSHYAVTVTFTNGVSSSPVALGAGSMVPSVVVAVGGADSGSFTATGPANAQTIPANTPIRIGSMTGTYDPHHNGSVTLTPSTLTIKALGTTTTCTPSGSVSPALTLTVSNASGSGGGSGSGGSSSGGSSSGGSGSGGSSTGGSSSGGSSTGGSSTGGSSTGGGTLPQTGPADDAAAFGLFGGTVLLAGVAGAFWLTRRSRNGRVNARM